MNRRIFLFGLGVGIIIGAALLQLMLMGEKQSNALTETQSTTKTYSQEDLDKAVLNERNRVQEEQKKQSEVSKEPVDQAEKTADAPATKPDEQAPSTAKTETNAGESAETKPARLIVRIQPNASITDTAELLFSQGVITDKKAFIDLMRKRTIRAGYFAFQGKQTLQQVRGIITSKPLDPEAAQRELAANKG